MPHPLSGTAAEYVWAIPLLPLAGFVINGALAVAGARLGPPGEVVEVRFLPESADQFGIFLVAEQDETALQIFAQLLAALVIFGKWNGTGQKGGYDQPAENCDDRGDSHLLFFEQ